MHSQPAASSDRGRAPGREHSRTLACSGRRLHLQRRGQAASDPGPIPATEPPDYDVMVVDDGSTDGSVEQVDQSAFQILRLGRVVGLGAAIRAAIHEARRLEYDVLVIMAANDKDRPEEIPRLLAPIRDEGRVLVFGLRYLPGGKLRPDAAVPLGGDTLRPSLAV